MSTATVWARVGDSGFEGSRGPSRPIAYLRRASTSTRGPVSTRAPARRSSSDSTSGNCLSRFDCGRRATTRDLRSDRFVDGAAGSSPIDRGAGIQCSSAHFSGNVDSWLGRRHRSRSAASTDSSSVSDGSSPQRPQLRDQHGDEDQCRPGPDVDARSFLVDRDRQRRRDHRLQVDEKGDDSTSRRISMDRLSAQDCRKYAPAVGKMMAKPIQPQLRADTLVKSVDAGDAASGGDSRLQLRDQHGDEDQCRPGPDFLDARQRRRSTRSAPR